MNKNIDQFALQVTAMVITYNEAANLTRCLDSVRWARRILIVDSGSTDDTLEIAAHYPNVEVVYRPFDDFASQCNFGLTHVVTPWVLSLDADYVITPELQQEIQNLAAIDNGAYEADFVYCIYGHPLRGTLYPPRKVLYKKDLACYQNQGHAHKVDVAGATCRLKGKVLHDDRKLLSRWLSSQIRYADREANFLLSTEGINLRRTDRIRLMLWPAPFLVFFYTLLAKRCLFDGRVGWFYVLQRTFAEILILLTLLDKKLSVLKQGLLHENIRN